MKKHLLIFLVFLSVGFISANATGTPLLSVTLATFADPSPSSNDWLFKVDFKDTKTLTGGWDYGKTGLILEIPYISQTFKDAWFDMSVVNITSVYGTFGQTSAGEINFYENGTTTNPLVTINFESGFVSRYGLGADEIFQSDNVTITGSKIPSLIVDEQFAFSFANLARLPGHTKWTDGFTATAAFTSSAVPVPEPTTICLLGLGVLSLLRRKR